MAGEEAQTSPPLRKTPSYASVDRTAAQAHNSNTSAQSALSGCSSALAVTTLEEHSSNSGDFLTNNDKDGLDASNAAITKVSTSGATTAAAETVITPSDGGGDGKLTVAAMEAGRASEAYGDLADFVVVAGDKDNRGDNKLAWYDAGIDIPLPRRHPEVARAMAAKLAKGRQRSELDASEVGKEI